MAGKEALYIYVKGAESLSWTRRTHIEMSSSSPSSSSKAGHEDKLWQAKPVDGVDQNIWKKADIGFSDSDTAFSLAIEATVGTKERGNIALDDITFTPQCK